MSAKPYPNWRVDTLINGQSSIDSSWTVEDFAALCLAAADQAGATEREQSKIASALSKHLSDEDYQAHFGEPRRVEPDYNGTTAREQYEAASAGRR